MTDQVEALEEFGKNAGIIADENISDSGSPQLPSVIVPGGPVSNTRSAKNLYEHIAPTKKLFLRDGNVCKVSKRQGVDILELVSSATACSLFEEFVQFVKPVRRDGKLKMEQTTISKAQADMYLSAEAKTMLPEISSILSCPIIYEIDRELHVSKPGYDEKTKTLILHESNLQPEGQPTTLSTSIEIIKLLVNDFIFQTPGDRSRAIAAFITPALKMGGHLRDSIPADVAEADKSQSGKTFRQKMIAALYNETLNIVPIKKGGVGSLDESFGTSLFEGRPFIQFDNVRGKFDLPSLEAFLTADKIFPVRAAYSKQVNIDPSKFMILINSNGYQTTPDLANRSSIVRIKKREGHHFKQWKGENGGFRGDLLGFIKLYQPVLLANVFEVIREWFKLGKQRTQETRHDFREWCQTLDWIVQNIFNEAPLMEGHKDAQTRVSNPAFTFLREVALKVDQGLRTGDAVRASEILQICQDNDIIIPGLAQDKQDDEAKAKMAIGKCLGPLFKERPIISIEGYQVERTIETGVSDAGNSQEFRTYTFTPDKKSE